MNIKETALAADMLNKLGDILANNICNDWEYPEGWTLADKQAFMKEYHEWNGDLEEYDDSDLDQHIGDFMVADFLAHKMDT